MFFVQHSHDTSCIRIKKNILAVIWPPVIINTIFEPLKINEWKGIERMMSWIINNGWRIQQYSLVRRLVDLNKKESTSSHSLEIHKFLGLKANWKIFSLILLSIFKTLMSNFTLFVRCKYLFDYSHLWHWTGCHCDSSFSVNLNRQYAITLWVSWFVYRYIVQTITPSTIAYILVEIPAYGRLIRVVIAYYPLCLQSVGDQSSTELSGLYLTFAVSIHLFLLRVLVLSNVHLV